MADNPFQPDRREAGRFQFGLGALLFMAIPVALLGGAWSLLTRSKPGEPVHWLGLVLVAAAPMALAILTSFYQHYRRKRRPRRRM